KTAVQRAAQTAGRAGRVSVRTVMAAIAGMFLAGQIPVMGIGLCAVLAPVLVALAIPAIGMKTVNTSASDYPQDLPAVKAYNDIQKSFPGKESAATVVVEDGDLSTGEGAAALAELK